MKVTQVAICPSDASKNAGRPALTPELLAASGARYSRNNEGLDAILAKIDPQHQEKSVDTIFRMVDYGHQSIADMVPVAMFIDGISIWLAFYVWTLCPTASGQESSTRYIKISLDGLMAPEEIGIKPQAVAKWRDAMAECFGAYKASLDIWEKLAASNPALMGIPRSLLEDNTETARKKVERMKRNYAFDRARYFLPVASKTNVMLLMSARSWVGLCQHLLSHSLPECRSLGEAVRSELAIAAPRMTKYARATEEHTALIKTEFQRAVKDAQNITLRDANTSDAKLSVIFPNKRHDENFVEELKYHRNRYSPVGSDISRTVVRFGWGRIAFGEIRDLNRHRTGTKYCSQIPRGFYCALDQVPQNNLAERNSLNRLEAIGTEICLFAKTILTSSDPAYIYWGLLGTEFEFEHVTTADKFIYEAELRTGIGAHFRYAHHLKQVLELWYQQCPDTRGLIIEGSAEPE